MQIDAHVHSWELGRFGYRWLESVPQLQRDFRLEKVLITIKQYDTEKIVLIEADNSLEETRWLLEVATKHPEILGVVGWVDAGSVRLEADLEALGQQPKFCGVRIGIWAETDPQTQYKLLGLLQGMDLTCDVLMGQGLLPKLLPLLRQFPDLTFVLNHCAGAEFSSSAHKAWSKQIAEAAVLPKVYMKLSGFSGECVEPYLQTALKCFGAQRLMFGSDYPVCTLHGSYGQTVEILKPFIDPRSAIWGATALRFYGERV